VTYGVVTVLGVLLLLFVLFFLVTTPDDIARRALGEKAPPEALAQWKVNHGYDKPRIWNPEAPTDTMLAEHFKRMLTFNFGNSDADDVAISRRLREGVGPSLALALPLFLIELPLALALALLVALLRETYVDRLGVTLCVLGMSVSVLLYIVGGQYALGKVLRWFPISGFDPRPAVIIRFLALPVAVGVLSGLGKGVRFYRTVFVEEVGRDHVRTARAKGCGEGRVMIRHVLRNALLPILTQGVNAVPFIFAGSPLVASLLRMPGLGRLTDDALNNH